MDFFIENSIYVPLVIAMVIMLGIIFYINRVDVRVRKLEDKEIS